MTIIKALVVLSICAVVLETFRDWSDLSGNAGVDNRSTPTLPVVDQQVTETAQYVDDESADVTIQPIEDPGTLDMPSVDKMELLDEPAEAIRRIDLHYSMTTIRV